MLTWRSQTIRAWIRKQNPEECERKEARDTGCNRRDSDQVEGEINYGGGQAQNRLSREVVRPPSLEICKTQLDKNLNNLT